MLYLSLVCPASIFYISTPISGPTRLTFTHFAIAVTVDQCARTCHEFNCAVSLLPLFDYLTHINMMTSSNFRLLTTTQQVDTVSSTHPQLSPSVTVNVQLGQVSTTGDLLLHFSPYLDFRNNVVASQSVRIFCVQCQRPRRRPNRQRVVGRHRVFDPRQQTRSFFRRPSRG